MKTHMDHADIINISTEMARELKFPMFPPSELKLIRYQLSISYGKQSSVNQGINSLIYASGCWK